jgi:hypothetical protein
MHLRRAGTRKRADRPQAIADQAAGRLQRASGPEVFPPGTELLASDDSRLSDPKKSPARPRPPREFGRPTARSGAVPTTAWERAGGVRLEVRYSPVGMLPAGSARWISCAAGRLAATKPSAAGLRQRRQTPGPATVGLPALRRWRAPDQHCRSRPATPCGSCLDGLRRSPSRGYRVRRTCGGGAPRLNRLRNRPWTFPPTASPTVARTARSKAR